MEDRAEARYAHLLEPIRDLAENWRIDIASELQDYLAELESITISWEDGSTLDFAEAALLIQGSACIYSKKVEHLYTLVYQTLNQVIEKKRAAKEASSLSEDGVDKDTQQFVEADSFLTLDDSIQEVDNIMLPTGAPSRVGTNSFTMVRPPLTLLPMGDNASCKMGACDMHSSGALLLPFLRLPPHVLDSLPSYGSEGLSQPYRDASEDVANKNVADVSGTTEEHHMDENAGFDDDDCGMDNMDDGAGWEGAIDAAASGLGPELVDEVAEETTAGDASQEPPRSPEAKVLPPRPPPAASWDPWAPLDPHDAGAASLRPFRRGRTYNANLSMPTHMDKGSEAAAEADKENGVTLCTNALKADVLSQLGLEPDTPGVVPLKQPLWAQFEVLYNIEAKRRANQRRMQRVKVAQRQHVTGTEAEVADVEVEALQGDATGGTADDDDDGPAGFEGFDNDFDPDVDVPPMDMDDNDDLPNVETDGPLNNEAVESYAREVTYEEICRAHVESCFEASAGYQEDLELHRRVDEWNARVGPLLDEQNCHPEFNISTYRERLLESFERIDHLPLLKQAKRDGKNARPILPFAEAARGEEQWEVCRMFLAALQLTNSGNINLVTEGSLDEGNLSLHVELLSADSRFDFSTLS
ncbi:hypothetical protein AB1Y20_019503 [Prymnesium parvum]|uniref:Condensin-2 complex subunit H2 n=1 Tax=Prymnesium parvum TaxID=97485 RepID=A0AB34JSM3_PRYPA